MVAAFLRRNHGVYSNLGATPDGRFRCRGQERDGSGPSRSEPSRRRRYIRGQERSEVPSHIYIATLRPYLAPRVLLWGVVVNTGRDDINHPPNCINRSYV